MPIPSKVVPDLSKVITKVEVTAYSVGQGMGHTIAAYNANNKIIHFAIVDLGTEGGRSAELEDTINKINQVVNGPDSMLRKQDNFAIIDAIFISHNDQDHHSGFTNKSMSELVKFKADKIFVGGCVNSFFDSSIVMHNQITELPKETVPSEAGEDYLWKKELINKVKEKLSSDGKLIHFQNNYTSLFDINPNKILLQWGESDDKVNFQVLMVNCASGQNASSLVLYCTFKNQGFLFCADATSITFIKIIDYFKIDNQNNNVINWKTCVPSEIISLINPELTAAYSNTFFMSIPHHGSNTTSADINKALEATDPRPLDLRGLKAKVCEEYLNYEQTNIELKPGQTRRTFMKELKESFINMTDSYSAEGFEKLYIEIQSKKSKAQNKNMPEAINMGKRIASRSQSPFVRPEDSHLLPKKKQKTNIPFQLKNFNVIDSNTNVLNSLAIFTQIFQPKYAHASAGFKSSFGHPSILPLNVIYSAMNINSETLLALKKNHNLNVVMYDAYARYETPKTPNIQTFGNVSRPTLNKEKWSLYDIFIDLKVTPHRLSMNPDTKTRIFSTAEGSYTKYFYLGNYPITNDSRVLSSVVKVNNLMQDISYYDTIDENKINRTKNAAGSDSYSTADWCFSVEKKAATTVAPKSVLCSVIPRNIKTYTFSSPQALPLQELLTSTSIYIGDKPTN